MRGWGLVAVAVAGCITGESDEIDAGTNQECLSPPPPPRRPPFVTSVAPATVDIGGGTSITITGMDFEGPDAQVSLGGRACSEVNVVSVSQIKCVTPRMDIEGTFDVAVRSHDCATPGICTGCITFRDILGPRPTESYPQQNTAVGCGPFSARLKFNEPIDPRGINTDTCYIADGTERAPSSVYCDFACTVACDPAATDVTAICIKPDAPLEPDTVYTVRFPCPADLKGNRLMDCEDIKWSFRTGGTEQCGG
jgi:hypothetical protein